MKKVTYYIAEDGTHFDDVDDCKIHEYGLTQKWEDLDKNIIFFYKDWTQIEKFIGNTMNDYMRYCYSCYSDCAYIKIENDIPEDFIDWLYTKYGIEIPYKKGIYSWADKWIEIHQKIKEMANEWNISINDIRDACDYIINND